MRRIALLLTAVLLVGLFCHLPAPALAATDDDAPVLVDAFPVKTSFATGERVEYMLLFHEPGGVALVGESGLMMLFQLDRSPTPDSTLVQAAAFRTETGAKVEDVTKTWLSAHPSDTARCDFVVKVSLPVGNGNRGDNHFMSGVYQPFSLSVSDRSGNQVSYGKASGYCSGGPPLPTSRSLAFTVKNPGVDLIAPVVKSAAFAATTVDAGKQLKFTVKAQSADGIGGFDFSLSMNDQRLPNGSYLYEPFVSGNVNRTVTGPDGNGVYTIVTTVTVPSIIPPGEYRLWGFDLSDLNGNETQGNAAMPGYDNLKVTIRNPGYSFTSLPTVEGFTLSKATARPGDTVTVTVQVNTHGATVDRWAELFVTNEKGSDLDTPMLQRGSDGRYRCNYIIPPDVMPGALHFGIGFSTQNGFQQRYGFGGKEADAFPQLQITSIFTGLDDITLFTGASMGDLLQGVSAANDYEGTIDPSRIKVANPPDFTKTGVYLVRYEVNSTRPTYDPETGVQRADRYTGYRWVGITEQLPQEVGDPFVSAPDSLTIGGATASDLSVSADLNGGAFNSVAFKSKYTTKGDYTLTKKGRGKPASKVQGRNGATAKEASALLCRVAARSVPLVRASSAGLTSVKVAWTKVFGATKYGVYRAASKNGIYTRVALTSALSFTEKNLTAGMACYYKVCAVVGGADGEWSAAIAAKPGSVIPAAVKAASAGSTGVKVSWSKVAVAREYAVYRAASAAGSYKKVGTSSGLCYQDKGLTAGKTYYYKVRAKCLDGGTTFGPYSSIVSAKPIPATPSSPKAVSAGYNSVKVSWAKVSGASGYELVRATSKTGKYTLVKTTTATSYSNTGLTTNKTYYYKVRAYRTVGKTKVYSASYSAAVTAKPVPTAPGRMKAARASSSSVKVSWAKVSGASGYEVARATVKTGKYTTVKTVTSGSAVGYTNTGLKKGTTYYFKLRAYRMVSGKKVYGAFSAIVSAKP